MNAAHEAMNGLKAIPNPLQRFYLGIVLGNGCFLFWRIEQLNQRHWCCIARPVTNFQNPKVTARSLLETRPQLGEQFADRFLVTQPVKR